MNCPTGMRMYLSPSEAADAARNIAKRHNGAARNKGRSWAAGVLKHFRCEECKHWHIGHMGKSKK